MYMYCSKMFIRVRDFMMVKIFFISMFTFIYGIFFFLESNMFTSLSYRLLFVILLIFTFLFLLVLVLGLWVKFEKLGE